MPRTAPRIDAPDGGCAAPPGQGAAPAELLRCRAARGARWRALAAPAAALRPLAARAALAALLACAWAGGPSAQQESAPPAAVGEGAAGTSSTGEFRVAILPVEYEEQGDSRIGQRISELLAATLRLNPALRVLDPDEVRRGWDGSLPRMLDVVRGGSAVALGGRLGVDAVLTGQAYVLGERFYVVVKVVGCASGRVFAAGAEGTLSAPLPEIVEALTPGVDDLLADRRLDLTLPGSRSRQAEETLAARVRALKRQKEPPPIILVVAEAEAGSGVHSAAALDRLSVKVRRLALTARPQRAQDLLDWARVVHEGGSRDVPRALRGQGIVLAMRLNVQSKEGSGALGVARAVADAEWLDARDGTRLASLGAYRDAIGRGQEAASLAAARRVAQAVFEESFASALTRWEARHKETPPAAAETASAEAP